MLDKGQIAAELCLTEGKTSWQNRKNAIEVTPLHPLLLICTPLLEQHFMSFVLSYHVHFPLYLTPLSSPCPSMSLGRDLGVRAVGPLPGGSPWSHYGSPCRPAEGELLTTLPSVEIDSPPPPLCDNQVISPPPLSLLT